MRRQSEIAAIAYVRQKEPLGLGHAVLMAKELVGDEPFAVLLPDDVMVNPGGAPVTAQLVEAHAAHRGSVVAITKVPQADVAATASWPPPAARGAGSCPT